MLRTVVGGVRNNPRSHSQGAVQKLATQCWARDRALMTPLRVRRREGLRSAAVECCGFANVLRFGSQAIVGGRSNL